jgi:uncharacterized protein YuzE
MKIVYDREVDALYIRLRNVKPDDSKGIEEGVTVDIDKQGHIVGIEILDATEKLGLGSLLNLNNKNMPLEIKDNSLDIYSN